MFSNFIQPLQKQADIIARGNKDLKQDILAMSFDSYQRAQERGKDLSIGELVNLLKYRAGSLRSGERLPFGNLSNKTTKDVFHKGNFFKGNVEVLSLDYGTREEEVENPGDGRGMFTEMISTRDFSDTVLFQIGYADFLKRYSLVNRQILQMRLEGYTLEEVAKATGFTRDLIIRRLRRMKSDFLLYFQLPREMA